MKLTCEYCGAVIVVEDVKDGKCPCCGASFDKNEQFLEIEEYRRKFNQEMLEQERLRTEASKVELEKKKRRLRYERRVERSGRIARAGCLLPILIIGLFFGALVVSTVVLDKPFDMPIEIPDLIEDAMDVNAGKMYIEGEEKITVKFNEKAVSERAEVVIDKAEIYNYPHKKPPTGMVYVRVHFTITNTSEEEFGLFNTIDATYVSDGVTVEAVSPTISSSDLDTKLRQGRLKPGLSTQGWVYFTVPKTGEFTVRCDKNVDIVISMKNVSSK